MIRSRGISVLLKLLMNHAETDQWAQKSKPVRLAALWLCGRTASHMIEGDAISPGCLTQ